MGPNHLQATNDSSRSRMLTRLHLVIDELLDTYPDVEDYVGTRSSAGAGGSSGGLAVPVNLEVLSFLNERYWARDDRHEKPPDEHTVAPPPCATWPRGGTGPRCRRCEGCAAAAAQSACRYIACAADPDNWRAGLKPTVFGLERSVRIALGFGDVQRDRGDYAGHGEDPWVLDALAWIRKSCDTLVDHHPELARTVRDEIARVTGRCVGMVYGARVELDATHSRCQHCQSEDSVWSDQVERAMCTNPLCRREDGTRYCWRFIEGEWTEVDEPVGRTGRGQNVSDERIEELVREAWVLKRARHPAPAPNGQ